MIEMGIDYNASQKKESSSLQSLIFKALCSGYLRKETAVIRFNCTTFRLPWICNTSVHLKNLHRKKGRNHYMENKVSEPMHGRQKVAQLK